jgi:hypothetical protein
VIFPEGLAELFSPYFSLRERTGREPITKDSSSMVCGGFRPRRKFAGRRIATMSSLLQISILAPWIRPNDRLGIERQSPTRCAVHGSKAAQNPPR